MDSYNDILSQLKAVNNSFYERNEDYIRRMERLEQIENKALDEFYREYPTYINQPMPYNYWGGISDDVENNLY